MALSVTDRGASNGSGFARSVGPFTPANGSLLVAIFSGCHYSANALANAAVSGGGLTWTTRVQVEADHFGNERTFVTIWTAPVTTGASTTVTSSNSGATSDGSLLKVFEITGHGDVGATATGGRGTLSDSTYTMDLSSAPVADSWVVAGCAIQNWEDSNPITNGTGWTETAEAAAGSSTWAQVQTRTGSTSPAVAWGTLNVNQQFGASEAFGALEIKVASETGRTGTLAATESGSDTAAITGAVLAAGALAATESGADTVAVSGAVLVSGSAAAVETGGDVAALTGTVGWPAATGTLAAQETGADTPALAGSVLVTGALGATETGSDTAEGAATALVSGALAATEAGSDTAAGSGVVPVSGALTASEAGSDTFAAEGSVEQQSGTMSAHETGPDVLSGSGSVAVSGALSAAETGADTFAGFAEGSPAGGTMAAVEVGDDTAAGIGSVTVSGALSGTEAADTASGSGFVLVAGSLAAAETGLDTFAGYGGEVPSSTGAMAAQEAGADVFTATLHVLRPRRPTRTGGLRPDNLSTGGREAAQSTARRAASFSTARRNP